ncbi:glycosyltransferase family 2 protein [Geminocystis sp. GBBB08]|uniref:glycosyltransferase family 2 protein n=1 Tax=Geminocystis sp. GBBB08 TaxID=2604140 RepID=UPI0027E3A9EB|nr:glycosyltransferase family 2 protein [Geminocystis sp. GBBB08]MBL1209092.1 glycosyltransferase family 2 protein [Geminocystis sp. GBBB08]
MAVSECFISVIAPVYNDSKIIESFIAEVIPLLRQNYSNYELVIVNDDSEDNTFEIVTSLLKEYECIRVISLSKHFGTEIAISSGLDSVIGDFVVVLLPASDPTHLIPELVEKCRQGTDILIGIKKNRQDEPLWMKIGANLFYWLCTKILKILLTKNATEFRVLSRQAINALLQVEDKYRYLRLLSNYIGYKSNTFIYEPIKRYKKIKNRGLWESIYLGLRLIFLNSAHPLRFASYLSLGASFFNLLYMVYIAGVYLIKDKVVEGWVTLSLQNSVMFFFISVILAILCEYIGLILSKSRGWSAYYILEEKTSSVLVSQEERPNIVQESKEIKLSN